MSFLSENKRETRVCPCLHQAAIGSTALDMARTKEDKQLQKYGMDVLTVAVLSILLTAPVGALIIGLTGPRLLQKPKSSACGERVKPTLSSFFLGMYVKFQIQQFKKPSPAPSVNLASW